MGTAHHQEDRMDAKALMTDKDVAKYLRLNEKTGHLTIRKWARAGKIKAGKAGSFWRFRKEDVDDCVFAGSGNGRR